jgi:hypothetical protein
MTGGGLFVLVVQRMGRRFGMRHQVTGISEQLLGGDQALGTRPMLEVLPVRPAFLFQSAWARSLTLRSISASMVVPSKLPSGYRDGAILTRPAAGRSIVGGA